MPAKILIIEDNDDIRESTAEILELAGYTVLMASEGRTGVELALQQLPEMILCDIMMPVMDGYGVLYLLNKHPEASKIPFIFLTAKAERADIRKGMDLGADDYLIKPFDDIELLHAIEVRLKKHQHAPALQQQSQRPLSEDELQKLLQDLSGREKAYKKKQSIYEEADTPQYLYQVKEGRIRTFLYYPDGRELTTGIFTTGEYFGYEAILVQQPYSESAETLDACTLRLIPKHDFTELMHQKPGLARKFIQLLSTNIRDKEEQLLRLAYHSVRKRVADALVSISHKFIQHPGDDECLIRISREDLAALTGTASETISRTLSDFKEEKLISREGNSIRLHSIEKLRKVKQ